MNSPLKRQLDCFRKLIPWFCPKSKGFRIREGNCFTSSLMRLKVWITKSSLLKVPKSTEPGPLMPKGRWQKVSLKDTVNELSLCLVVLSLFLAFWVMPPWIENGPSMLSPGIHVPIFSASMSSHLFRQSWIPSTWYLKLNAHFYSHQ